MTGLPVQGDKEARIKGEKGCERLREEYVDAMFRASDFRPAPSAVDTAITSLGFPAAMDLLSEMGDFAPKMPARSRAAVQTAEIKAVPQSTPRGGGLDAYAAMIESMLKVESKATRESEAQAA